MVVAGMHLYTSQPAPERVDRKDDGFDDDDDDEGEMLQEDNVSDGKDEIDETGIFLPAISIPGDCDVANHHPHNGTEKYASVLQQELPEVPQSALVESEIV